MAISVYCLASDRAIAVAVVEALRTAGLRGSAVSVVYPHRQPAPRASPPAAAHDRSAAADAGDLGAAVGWLMGRGSVAIPGIGLLIAAGPILALLSGTENGSMSDGLAGSLIGHGIPALVARRFDVLVRAGQVLISVHAMDGPDVDTVVRLLKLHGADHIHAATDAIPAAIAHAMRSGQEHARKPHAHDPART